MEWYYTAIMIGFIGGLLRTFRDMYKRYLDKQPIVDYYDAGFDIVFGIAAGVVAFLASGESDFTNAVVLLVMSAAYTGADILDGVFGKKVATLKA